MKRRKRSVSGSASERRFQFSDAAVVEVAAAGGSSASLSRSSLSAARDSIPSTQGGGCVLERICLKTTTACQHLFSLHSAGQL